MDSSLFDIQSLINKLLEDVRGNKMVEELRESTGMAAAASDDGPEARGRRETVGNWIKECRDTYFKQSMELKKRFVETFKWWEEEKRQLLVFEVEEEEFDGVDLPC